EPESGHHLPEHSALRDEEDVKHAQRLLAEVGDFEHLIDNNDNKDDVQFGNARKDAGDLHARVQRELEGILRQPIENRPQARYESYHRILDTIARHPSESLRNSLLGPEGPAPGATEKRASRFVVHLRKELGLKTDLAAFSTEKELQTFRAKY